MKEPPHQVRNMMLHLQNYLKSKKYLERAKKLHQDWLLIRMPQNMHYWLMKQPPNQVRNMLLHPLKVSKVKEISGKVKKKVATNRLLKKCNTSKGIWKGQKSCTKTGY